MRVAFGDGEKEGRIEGVTVPIGERDPVLLGEGKVEVGPLVSRLEVGVQPQRAKSIQSRAQNEQDDTE